MLEAFSQNFLVYKKLLVNLKLSQAFKFFTKNYIWLITAGILGNLRNTTGQTYPAYITDCILQLVLRVQKNDVASLYLQQGILLRMLFVLQAEKIHTKSFLSIRYIIL